MKSVAQSLKSFLPNQPKKVYPPVGRCIYCNNTDDLTVEHIIPFGLGGRLELPESSCHRCCKITSDFEHTCLRTMYGPLRLLYDLPSRRKKFRPPKLPLKVKQTAEDDWTYIDVEQERYPFLILFPQLSMPNMLTNETVCHGAKAKTFWIRGASPSYVFKDLLQQLTIQLNVHTIMPEAKVEVDKFCQMLAKIAYSFAIGELGVETFTPFMIPHILHKEQGDVDNYIGCWPETEKATKNLHEISIVEMDDKNLVVVRIRLLAKLETPIYIVVTGKYKT
ncbi:MAG: hypothetical protein JW837_05370 [Sedimentisphaerales bacterium]|nr:hypothetical protein [Sedimentisphaerales bacterium]